MKKFVILIVILAVLAGAWYLYSRREADYQAQSSTSKNNYEYYYNNKEKSEKKENLLPDDLTSIIDDYDTVPLDTNPQSITVLVNRTFLMPASYIPAKLVEPNVKFSFYYSAEKRKLRKVAATALEKMFTDAAKKGCVLVAVSGYRSYARQKQIYNRNIQLRGSEETDAVSAKPGCSEHQTGLAIDISTRAAAYELTQSFGNMPEGKWVAKNAHKYGYIVRYPRGKDDITGYSYEPWHIRYVGKYVATYLYKHHLTMEEYYGESDSGVVSAGDSTNKVDVEDADKVKLNSPTPKPKN